MKWTTDTEYGTLDVTINLSKPEKDPKAIAAAKNAKQSAYPKCQLCKENEGYAGPRKPSCKRKPQNYPCYNKQQPVVFPVLTICILQ